MPVMFVVVLAGLLGGMPAGEARSWYPWCAHYVGGIPLDCAYVSHDQCMRTVSGVSGFCTHNPMPPPPEPLPRRQRRTK
jgi:hypothetical protein